MKIFDFFILLGTILPLQAQLELTAVGLPKKLEETSGLEYLGTHFITHNDSGDEPKLYEFSKEGTLLKSTHMYTINAIDLRHCLSAKFFNCLLIWNKIVFHGFNLL
jgi:hypothetical protein